MTNQNELSERFLKIVIVGMGYVGLPLAIAFSRYFKVMGYDVSLEKIEVLKRGIDPTREVEGELRQNRSITFTNDPSCIAEAKFVIIAVPTPVLSDNSPDFRPLVAASSTVAENMRKGTIVVYESTVYPGVTEEVCIPILEKHSGLECGKDFKVGYSPERINPGDKVNRLENIKKLVSGCDEDALEVIAKIYSRIIKAGVVKTRSIKVAEAAKIIENSQRDVNIAFMNELAIIFNKMGINTQEVINAASTKWNFLKFYPGLVGGHCIGVDPYYLTYKAATLGYHSRLILAGRQINDSMSSFIVDCIIKEMAMNDIRARNAKVLILGCTFKENCPDIRNSKVIDIITELKKFDMEVLVADPVANSDELKKETGIELYEPDFKTRFNILIIAVAHDEYKHLSLDQLESLLEDKKSGRIVVDVKGIFQVNEFIKKDILYWSL